MNGRFLSLFPSEMLPGDVWGEGLEIVELVQCQSSMEWFILFNLTEPSFKMGQWVRWPNMAPRRLFRPEEVAS